MTIPEAIAEMNVILEISRRWALTEEKEAIKLGIEGLKQLRAIREAHPAFIIFELPGETPEPTEASHET